MERSEENRRETLICDSNGIELNWVREDREGEVNREIELNKLKTSGGKRGRRGKETLI